jgi:hypothetical protein
LRHAPTRLIAAPLIALTFAVTACGGATVAYKQAPGDPVDLSVPGNGDALAPEATPTPTATPTETAEADASQATPTPDANTGAGTTQQTTPQGNNGGGTEAPAEPDSATNDQPPPAGSDAQQFEDFCAENPGAC